MSDEKSANDFLTRLEELRQRLAALQRRAACRSISSQAADGHGELPAPQDALGGLARHDHVCLIYEEHGQWQDALISFARAGLTRDERILYLGAANPSQLRSILFEAGIDVAAAETAGRIRLLGGVPGGRGSFDPQRAVALLITEAEKATADGFSALRIVNGLARLLSSADLARLAEFEAQLDRDLLPNYPCVVLCSYDHWELEPQVVKAAVVTHPLLAQAGRVYPNLYYTPPAQALARKAGECELEWWLWNVERQNAREEHSRFLAEALERAPLSFCAFYPGGRIITASHSFSLLTGYTAGELARLSWGVDFTPREWRRAEASALEQLRETGQPQRYTKQLSAKDGALLPVEVALCQGSRRGDGEFYYAFLRRVESTDAAGRTGPAADAHLAAQLTQLVDLIPDFVYRYELQPEQRFSFVSRSAQQALGYGPEDFAGDPELLLHAVDPEDRSQLEAQLAGRSASEPQVIRYRHRAGHTVWLEQRSVPVPGPDGTIVAVEGVGRDVTARLRAEGQNNRAQRLEAARQIAGQVAHDFNNLLGPLAGYPELIKIGLPADHPAVRYCDAMLEAAQQMAAVNTNLLALARRGVLDPAPVDLNQLATLAVEQMGPLPEKLSVELDLGAELPRPLGSATQLLRAVASLLANAREAMREEGALNVRTDYVRLDQPAGVFNRIEAGEYVRLTVSDTGSGIPAELQGRIFDPFFTTRRGERRAGGLGLTIAFITVTDHHGFVDLETEVGRGSAFSIYLPVHRG